MHRIVRRSLLRFASAFAATSPWTAHAAADPAVMAPVRALIAALLTIMKQGSAVPFTRRMETLAPVVDQSFDLGAILRKSVGTATWDALPPDRQADVRDAFRGYTIASYVRSFDAFNGQRFEVLPDTRAVGTGAQIVQTRIVPTGGDTHALDYVMRAAGGGWRIVDVLADGSVSRVAVQRSDFRRLVAQGGVAALVASLRQKAGDLAKP